MTGAQRNRLARIEARLPASPSPRAAEADVEDLVGLSLDELLVRFEERGGPEARRRRAELDAMSDAELLIAWERKPWRRP